MKNKNFLFMCTFMVLIFLASCADVTNVSACATTEPYGFWGGLWHGMVSPISFIGSLFSDHIAMYAHNNNGHWYDFGFTLGAGILGGGIGFTRRRR
jgi:hypothetical protein